MRHVPLVKVGIEFLQRFGNIRRKRDSAHLMSCLTVPFTLMLSPRCASVRISSQSEMVSEVPPPPLDEVSRDVTARK